MKKISYLLGLLIIASACSSPQKNGDRQYPTNHTQSIMTCGGQIYNVIKGPDSDVCFIQDNYSSIWIPYPKSMCQCED